MITDAMEYLVWQGSTNDLLELCWALPKNSTPCLKDGQTLGARAPSPAIEREAQTIVTDFFDCLACCAGWCGRGRPRSHCQQACPNVEMTFSGKAVVCKKETVETALIYLTSLKRLLCRLLSMSHLAEPGADEIGTLPSVVSSSFGVVS
jgi:hypothetical protein